MCLAVCGSGLRVCRDNRKDGRVDVPQQSFVFAKVGGMIREQSKSLHGHNFVRWCPQDQLPQSTRQTLFCCDCDGLFRVREGSCTGGRSIDINSNSRCIVIREQRDVVDGVEHFQV